MKFVWLSNANFSLLLREVPVTGTRGSFAEANGSAFLITPVTSKLSPTTQRFWLELNDHIGLSAVVVEKVIYHRYAVGTAEAGTTAAASVNLPWSIRMRALVTSRLIL